jgi:hypothetical protein
MTNSIASANHSKGFIFSRLANFSFSSIYSVKALKYDRSCALCSVTPPDDSNISAATEVNTSYTRATSMYPLTAEKSDRFLGAAREVILNFYDARSRTFLIRQIGQWVVDLPCQPQVCCFVQETFSSPFTRDIPVAAVDRRYAVDSAGRHAVQRSIVCDTQCSEIFDGVESPLCRDSKPTQKARLAAQCMTISASLAIGATVGTSRSRAN